MADFHRYSPVAVWAVQFTGELVNFSVGDHGSLVVPGPVQQLDDRGWLMVTDVDPSLPDADPTWLVTVKPFDWLVVDGAGNVFSCANARFAANYGVPH